MNRRRRHIILLALVIALAVAAGSWRLRLSVASQRPVARADLAAAASATAVYVLDEERWTVFRIPAGAHRIQLLSHAGMLAQSFPNDGDDLRYRIAFRLATLAGDCLDEGELGYRVGARPRLDAEGRPTVATFYENAALVPASSRRSHFDIDPEEVHLLSVRLGGSRPPVHDVVVRVACRQDVPERKLNYLWERKSGERRRVLTAGRVHGLIDLTDEERTSLLLTRWSPVGPQGVGGADYVSRTLYLRDDAEAAAPIVEHRIGGDLPWVEPGLRATLGIPQPGLVKLRFVAPAAAAGGSSVAGTNRSRNEESSASSPAPVRIRWFGGNVRERRAFVHETADGGEFSADLGAGILEIESDAAWSIDGALSDPGGGAVVPLVPRHSIVRAWRCGGTSDDDHEALGFSFGPGAAGNLVRLAFRTTPDAATDVRLAWLGDDGKPEPGTEEVIRVEGVASPYDRIRDGVGLLPVSEAQDIVLTIPSDARRLEIRSEAEVFVRAYTRPLALIQRTRVPDDYHRGIDDSEGQPIWFPLMPEDGLVRTRAFRSVLLRVQERPPEDDVDVLAGRYEWEDFDPASGGLGAYLLCDRNPLDPARMEAAGSGFMAVPADGTEFLLPPTSLPGLDVPMRRLVYLRSRDEGAPMLRVFFDRQLLLEHALATPCGEILLPPLDVRGPDGARASMLRIECEEPGIRCFVNHVPPEKATRLKRFAHRFGPERTLEFDVERRTDEPELLTATWFGPRHEMNEVVVRMAIDSEAADVQDIRLGGILAGFTPRRREFILSVAEEVEDEGEAHVLGGSTAELAGGRSFFIPLGPDLPAGMVTLRFEMRSGAEGYLALSRVTGGEYSWARFAREEGR